MAHRVIASSGRKTMKTINQSAQSQVLRTIFGDLWVSSPIFSLPIGCWEIGSHPKGSNKPINS
jgi:hypothetical protein